MDQRAHHNRHRWLTAAARADDGSLSTYIAVAVVLPLLAMLAGAGIALSGLAATAANVSDARDVASLAAEVQGGVTSQVVAAADNALAGLGLSVSAATVTGTPAPVAWGGEVAVTVTEPVTLTGFPWTLLGLAGQTVTLGGTTYATSNVAP